MDNNYLTQLGQTLSEPVFQKPDINNYLALFGGARSQTADVPKLNAAIRMDAAKVPRETIWQETGWFRGPDGKWRYEIDDSQARVSFGRGPLNALVSHPAFENAYPNYRNMQADVVRTPPLDKNGDYGHLSRNGLLIQATNPDVAKVIAIHELQHAIQNYEGFAPGARLEGFRPELGGNGVPANEYAKSPGEIEAYIAGTRANTPPEQRRQNPPWVLWEYLQGK